MVGKYRLLTIGIGNRLFLGIGSPLKYCFTQYDGKHCSNLVHLNDKNLFSMRNGEVYMAGLF